MAERKKHGTSKSLFMLLILVFMMTLNIQGKLCVQKGLLEVENFASSSNKKHLLQGRLPLANLLYSMQNL